MFTFKRIDLSLTPADKYIELFNECFPKSSRFTINYIDWLYKFNPNGSVFGFDAWNGNDLVAHYACIPAPLKIHGQFVNSLQSINTATKKAYQGKGLFTKLAELTYHHASSQGFDCVFGVANKNSSGVFLNKLNFQLISPLYAHIFLGNIEFDDSLLDENIHFSRYWSSESVEWRTKNPSNPISFYKDNNQFIFKADIIPNIIGIQSSLTINSKESKLISNKYPEIKNSFFNLFLGLYPEGYIKNKITLNIPFFLRPSPLNLIYKSLDKSNLNLKKNDIYFNFLDFDPY